MTPSRHKQLSLLAEQVVVGLDQTFKMSGRRKRALGLEVLSQLARERRLEAPPDLLEQVLDKAVRRCHRRSTRALAWVSRAVATLSMSLWALGR